MKHWIFSILSMLSLLFPFRPGGAGESINLKQCLEIGIQNNPSLEAARLGVTEAGHDIKSARADFLPSLSSGYSVNFLTSESSKGPTETDYLDQNVKTFHIKLTQILYAGSRIVTTYDRAKIRERVLKAEMDLARLELIYHIETTFYRLMKAKQDVISAEESVNRLVESSKSAMAYFQKELVPYVDALQAKVDLADAQEVLGIARNNVNRERASLFALLNMEENSQIRFAGELTPALKEVPSFADNLEQAILNRPDIKSLEFQLRLAEKDAKIALGKYLPMVRLDLGYYDQDRDYDNLGISGSTIYDRDQRNRYWSSGIYATWDMFDGGRAWHERQKYKIEADRIRALIDDAKNTIATGIRRALYSMAEAERRMTVSIEALAAAREYYEGEDKRLKAGISTITALLNAQERLIRSQTNETQAILDYRLAQSELRLMTGKKE